MKRIRDLLLEADPLQHEPFCRPAERDIRRKAVLAAASDARLPSHAGSRSRLAAFATLSLILVVGSFLAFRADSLFVGRVQAAVRFEVKLAEDKPAPGLREVRAPRSQRAVYVHRQAVVSNSDVASARVLPVGADGRHSLEVEFTMSGAEKMRRATEAHVGKPLAVFIDGQVVTAP